MEATSIPTPAAMIPFSATRPARMPTIERPKAETINNSGDLNSKTTGRAIRMKKVRKLAPTIPPNSEEANAADRARAAIPFFAMGNPSRTVACDADEPGIPIRTEANVSEVGTTATIPTINARPRIGSSPNMKGSTSDRPAMPPRPGKIPIARPNITPRIRYPITRGWIISCQPSIKASNAMLNKSICQNIAL